MATDQIDAITQSLESSHIHDDDQPDQPEDYANISNVEKGK